MAVPHMPVPLCLIENQDNGFKINDETVRVISQITSPVTVVSIVGPYRTGKSYLLNRLMGRNNGFALGSAVQSKTKGIWIWCCPHPIKKDQVLILLDTEGLGDIEKGSNTNDNHLFSLATLLSSTLVYNNIGTLQNDAIDKLHFVSEMTELIKVRSSTVEEDGSEFRQFFPDFIWAVRDFTLELNLDGKPISADEYLENSLKLKQGGGKKITEYNLPRQCIRSFFRSLKCFVFDRPVKNAKLFKIMETLREDELDPDFLRMAKSFCDYVFSKSMLKTFQGKSLNGSSLCGIATMYVETLNSGRIPCLENAYEALAKIENEKAFVEALEVYNGIRQFLVLPAASLDDLSDLHRQLVKQALDTFTRKAFNDVDNDVQRSLHTKMEEMYNAILVENEQASETVCQEHLRVLSAALDDNLVKGVYITPGGFKLYSKDKDEVIKQYGSKTGKGVKAEEVLQKYLQAKEPEGINILKGDKELTEKEKQLAAKQQESEQAAQRERAAREEQEKTKQRMQDQQAVYEENLKQIQQKMKEEQERNQAEFDRVLETQLGEQKKLLNEGFKKQANAIDAEIAAMKKKMEEESQKSGGFFGFLTDALSVVASSIPIVGKLFGKK